MYIYICTYIINVMVHSEKRPCARHPLRAAVALTLAFSGST